MPVAKNQLFVQDEALGRRVVVSYPTYREALQVVDFLVSKEIARDKLTIAAEELRFLEKLSAGSPGRAAILGVLTGGLIGLAFGFFFGLFSWIDPLISGSALAVYGFALGSIVGAVLGLAAHRFSGERATPYDAGHLQAGRYAVLAKDDVAEQAISMTRMINRPRIVR
jgi:hypothetical protein